MKTILLKTCLAAIVAGVLPMTVPAFAQQAVSAQSDPRIRHIGYAENSVYRLDLGLKSVTAVQFSDDETIESILIGDSASWEVVKLKNGHVISIKAKIPSTQTNMTVYSDRRVYTFELHSLSELASNSTYPAPLRTVFTYPAKKAVTRKPGPAQPEQINSNYMVAGTAEFSPLWVQDNGRQTSFFLPENASRPAIFKVADKNEEQLINSRTVGSRIVVDGVSDYWVLRIGDKTVCVARKAAAAVNPNVRLAKGGGHAG